MQKPVKPLPISDSQPLIQSGEVDENEAEQDKPWLANVNKIFTTLRLSYPAWYNKHYGNLNSERLAKRIWLAGVRELTTEQVNLGLKRLVLECEYPPSLHDFIKLCKRIDGLPSSESAWAEALLGEYSHYWVKLAAQLTGVFELLRSGYDNQSLKKQFEYHYTQVIEHFSMGKPLQQYDPGSGSQMQERLADIDKEALRSLDQKIAKLGINKANARAKCLAILGLNTKA